MQDGISVSTEAMKRWGLPASQCQWSQTHCLQVWPPNLHSVPPRLDAQSTISYRGSALVAEGKDVILAVQLLLEVDGSLVPELLEELLPEVTIMAAVVEIAGILVEVLVLVIVVVDVLMVVLVLIAVEVLVVLLLEELIVVVVLVLVLILV